MVLNHYHVVVVECKDIEQKIEKFRSELEQTNENSLLQHFSFFDLLNDDCKVICGL